MNGNLAKSAPQAIRSHEFEIERSLHLLSNLEHSAIVSQQSLALRLGVAVGLTNAYVKRAVRKGWVKMQKVPARRYAYYLTPKGMAEKSRLAAEYLSSSFGFFRRARSQCLEALREAERRGFRRIALLGAGELAEIASLAARETGIELVAIIQPGSNQETFAGLPLLQNLSTLQNIDAYVVTDITAPQKTFDGACAEVEEERILTPQLLHVSRRREASQA